MYLYERQLWIYYHYCFQWIFWIWFKLFTVVGKRLYINSIMQKIRTDTVFSISICILSKNIPSSITVYFFFFASFFKGGGNNIFFFKYWNWWTLNRVRFLLTRNPFFTWFTSIKCALTFYSDQSINEIHNKKFFFKFKLYNAQSLWMNTFPKITAYHDHISKWKKNTRVVQKVYQFWIIIRMCIS